MSKRRRRKSWWLGSVVALAFLSGCVGTIQRGAQGKLMVQMCAPTLHGEHDGSVTMGCAPKHQTQAKMKQVTQATQAKALAKAGTKAENTAGTAAKEANRGEHDAASASSPDEAASTVRCRKRIEDKTKEAGARCSQDAKATPKPKQAPKSAKKQPLGSTHGLRDKLRAVISRRF